MTRFDLTGSPVANLPRTLAGQGLIIRTDALDPQAEYAMRLARYRESAIRGIRRAWEAGLPRPLRIITANGPACFVANKPRSTPQVPGTAPAVPNPLSKNNRRLPLRLLDERGLSFHYWSQGKTLHQYETLPPRGIEKPIEDQSLDELCGGNAAKTIERLNRQAERGHLSAEYGEPLSESRRSYLTAGHGVLTLDLPKAADDGAISTIAEFVPDDHPLRQFEAVTDGLDPNDVEYESPLGAAYTYIDPTVQKQIQWERDRFHESEVITVRLQDSPEGKLQIAPVGATYYTNRDALTKAMKGLRDWLIGTVGPVKTLHEAQDRLDLIREGIRSMNVTRDFDYEAVRSDIDARRYAEPADEEWHSAYEMPVPSVGIFVHDDGTEEAVVHTKTTRLVHPRPRVVGSPDEFYRHRLFNPAEFELGTEGMVSPIALWFDPLVGRWMGNN